MRRTLITLAALGVGATVALVAFDGGRHFVHAAAGAGSDRMEKWCNEDSKDWAEKVTKRVNKELKLNDDQADAWSKVDVKLRAGADAVKSACREEIANGIDETAPAHLAFMERMMEVGLDEFKEARVEFDEFYDTLDDEQKAEVNEHLSHKHHHRDRGHHDKDE